MAHLGALAAILAVAPLAEAQGADRYAAFVIDAQTNEVLHADQADEARYPASLTKMMTLYMLFEALERGEVRMGEALPVSRRAAGQSPSRLGMRAGDRITVEDAILALVVRSANDVAVVVAERLGGSETGFARMMTTRARQLGMANTQFINASGLPSLAQTTTARDMATLSMALLRDFPNRYPLFSTPDMSWRNRYGRNHNNLLGRVPGVDGLKTGYTRASGFNLATSASREGRRIFVVVMGGESGAARDAQVAYLIENAYEELRRRADGGATLVALPMSPQVEFLPSGPMTGGETTGGAVTPVVAPRPPTVIEPRALAQPETDGEAGAASDLSAEAPSLEPVRAEAAAPSAPQAVPTPDDGAAAAELAPAPQAVVAAPPPAPPRAPRRSWSRSSLGDRTANPRD